MTENLPAALLKVWSFEGPVLEVGVAPDPCSHLYDPRLVSVHPHRPPSKVQLPPAMIQTHVEELINQARV